MLRGIKTIVCVVFVAGGVALSLYAPVRKNVYAQQPTGSIPTVTGTPPGAIITVYSDVTQTEVYAGPSSHFYPVIGLMLAGQRAPAYGFSADGQWIQIYYPGVPDSVAWIYAPYVSISRGADLPELEAPPTPTPASTPTIEPTLAAAFITPGAPHRLPTFTAPAPLALPTFVDETSAAGRVPMGLLIFGLGF